MLDILQQIRADMQSMTARFTTLEKNKDTQEIAQSQSDASPQYMSSSETRKNRDRQLSKTQALVLDAVGPMAFILEAAAKGNLTQEIAVEAAQTALKLLGNASCHLATERKNVLTDLNPSLKDMAEEDKLYKEAAPNLFGEGFLRKAKERDEELKVLKSTRPPQKRSTAWKGKENQNQFFQARRSHAQATRGGSAFRGHQNRPVQQAKTLSAKRKATDCLSEQSSPMKKQRTSEPSVMYFNLCHLCQAFLCKTNT